MAPVVKAIEKSKGLESRICITAQHREMLDQVLNLFNLKPDYDLDIMQPDQTINFKKLPRIFKFCFFEIFQVNFCQAFIQLCL